MKDALNSLSQVDSKILYYGNFRGYGIPLHPCDPITSDETADRDAFFEVEKDSAGRVAVITKISRVRPKADPVTVDLLQSMPANSWVYFEAKPGLDEGEWAPGDLVDYQFTQSSHCYYFGTVDSDGISAALRFYWRERTGTDVYLYGDKKKMRLRLCYAYGLVPKIRLFDAKGRPDKMMDAIFQGSYSHLYAADRSPVGKDNKAVGLELLKLGNCFKSLGAIPQAKETLREASRWFERAEDLESRQNALDRLHEIENGVPALST